jgi:phospholipid-transporting ATPase
MLYCFYKNICLYIIGLWFAFFSAFSGVTIFERWCISVFNVFFTAWPPIILGLFDRPISQQLILSHPQIYQSFQKMAYCNSVSFLKHFKLTILFKRFIMWIGGSLWHSLVLFFLTYFIYGFGILWETGRNGGWLIFGNALFTVYFKYILIYFCCFLVCGRHRMHQIFAGMRFMDLGHCHFMFWFNFFLVSVFGNLFHGKLLIFVLILFCHHPQIWYIFPFGADVNGMFVMMVSSPTFWLSFIFVPIFTLSADLIIKAFVSF